MRSHIYPFQAILLCLAVVLCCISVGCKKTAPTSTVSWSAQAVVRSFEELSPDDQIWALKEAKKALSEVLLKPSEDTLDEYRELLSHPDIEVNRILYRDKAEGLTTGRGGGSYFSFTARVNDYNKEPDLMLGDDHFDSGFMGGDSGNVVRMESTTVVEITLDDVPENLLVEIPESLRPRDRKKVEVNDVYVVRSIRLGESDILVALQVLQKDDYGVTFAWRVLKKFKTPPSRR